MRSPETADVLIVGAGAAGLAVSLFCARAASTARIVCVDGARVIGAKILVSGGSRCNVTNREVSERDFWGGERRLVRNVLRAFPAQHAAALFEELGVTLRQEEDGKLFPSTNRSRTVLDALLRGIAESGVQLQVGRRIVRVQRHQGAFLVSAADGSVYEAPRLVLATGGRSLPKSGSDGAGYAFARALGHGYIETTPALVPLVLNNSAHAELAGVAVPVTITVRASGTTPVRLTGPMLWTHFGASGPVILNASRHWLRAEAEGRAVDMSLNLLPGQTFDSVEAWLLEQQREHPRTLLRTMLATRLPASVVDVWGARADVDVAGTLAHLARDDRRRLISALLETSLHVGESRGYNYAEVTAGGIPLTEIDSATMESRKCPGLYLVGEILDVDGRLGGFNFQWAWSSAWVAAQALAKSIDRSPI